MINELSTALCYVEAKRKLISLLCITIMTPKLVRFKDEYVD